MQISRSLFHFPGVLPTPPVTDIPAGSEGPKGYFTQPEPDPSGSGLMRFGFVPFKAVDAETLLAAQTSDARTEKNPVAELAKSNGGSSEAREAFKDYMSKTPEERWTDAELRRRGMTREEFEALPPEEREAVMQDIQEALKDRIRERTENQLQQAYAPQTHKQPETSLEA